MNIHESLLDEFKEESKLTQLALTDEQKEAWIMVSVLLFIVLQPIIERLSSSEVKGVLILLKSPLLVPDKGKYMYMYVHVHVCLCTMSCNPIC